MQTSAIDRIVGVDVHDARVWFLMRWFSDVVFGAVVRFFCVFF